MAFTKGHKLAKGGKREGAGRKPDLIKELGAKREISAIEAIAFGADIDVKYQLAALIYLTDRKLGKPKEPKEHTGEITVTVRQLT